MNWAVVVWLSWAVTAAFALWLMSNCNCWYSWGP
jgi:hypothetical protein